MKSSIGYAALAVLVVGCQAPVRPPERSALATRGSVAELAAAIAENAQRSDHEPDAKVREALADEASHAADACLAREPQAAACLYGRAVASGLEARAHPIRAGELLNSMIANLASAEAADAGYDDAGPARVRALVLIRAPGWPLGPGDPDAGLAAARRAVALRPQYPPNLLALGEALQKTGDANGAQQAYEQARNFAQALPSAPDRDDWLHTASQALQHK